MYSRSATAEEPLSSGTVLPVEVLQRGREAALGVVAGEALQLAEQLAALQRGRPLGVHAVSQTS